jgi:hypothetical protein
MSFCLSAESNERYERGLAGVLPVVLLFWPAHRLHTHILTASCMGMREDNITTVLLLLLLHEDLPAELSCLRHVSSSSSSPTFCLASLTFWISCCSRAAAAQWEVISVVVEPTRDSLLVTVSQSLHCCWCCEVAAIVACPSYAGETQAQWRSCLLVCCTMFALSLFLRT